MESNKKTENLFVTKKDLEAFKIAVQKYGKVYYKQIEAKGEDYIFTVVYEEPYQLFYLGQYFLFTKHLATHTYKDLI